MGRGICQEAEREPDIQRCCKDMGRGYNVCCGECRKAMYSDSLENLPKAAFTYRGPYSNWRKLIDKQIDPIQGILTGKFKLEGSMMKIMRYTKAAKEMVNTATLVQTEF